MFDRFTEPARNVMVLARKAAISLNHDSIGPEHVLLGLAEEDSGILPSVFEDLDVDVLSVHSEVEAKMQAGEMGEPPRQMPFTQQAQRVLEHTLEEAVSLGHDHLGTEHLLLGLLREDEGIVSEVLKNRGLQLEAVRARLL